MGNRLGISAATSSSTSPSQHHPPRRPTSPSTQASGIAATSYSAASSSNTSSPASLLSTSSASQEDERRTSAEITTTTANALTTTSAPLSTTITAATTISATETTTISAAGRRRLRNTQADRYYEQYQQIPLPPILHDNLQRMMKKQVMDVKSKDVAKNDGKNNGIIMNKNGDGAIGLDIAALTIGNNTDVYPQNNINNTDTTIITTTNNKKRNIQRSKRILVIGDVHGCITELHTLVQKATQQHNSGIPFAAIIIVGDLCNKGPHSTAVIRHVRTQPNWFSIRGNNEDRALTYALSQWDEKDTTIKQKYKWIAYGEDPLSDEDVEWMANLPYTITIPKTMFDDYYHDEEEYDDEENEEEEEEEEVEMNLDSCSSDTANENHGTRTSTAKRQRHRLHDDDIIIVHAGLDTRIPTLEKQDIHTMVNIRDVQIVMNDKATTTENDDTENNTVDEDENDGNDRNRDHGEKEQEQEQEVLETKKKERTAWAKLWQGPQVVIFGHDARRGLQTEKYAIGLDSGCCYGRELTGIILPEGEYVSVEATRVHCPFKKKKK